MLIKQWKPNLVTDILLIGWRAWWVGSNCNRSATDCRKVKLLEASMMCCCSSKLRWNHDSAFRIRCSTNPGFRDPEIRLSQWVLLRIFGSNCCIMIINEVRLIQTFKTLFFRWAWVSTKLFHLSNLTLLMNVQVKIL